jgi:hypothetical protein
MTIRIPVLSDAFDFLETKGRFGNVFFLLFRAAIASSGLDENFSY